MRTSAIFQPFRVCLLLLRDQLRWNSAGQRRLHHKISINVQEKYIELFMSPFLAMLRARPDVHEQILIPILAAFQDVCSSEDDSDYLDRATLLVRVLVVTHADDMQSQRIRVRSSFSCFLLSKYTRFHLLCHLCHLCHILRIQICIPGISDS